MKSMVFESKVLADGHLYCPKKIARKRRARFKVLVYFDAKNREASNRDIEAAAVSDLENGDLSEKETSYYRKLTPE